MQFLLLLVLSVLKGSSANNCSKTIHNQWSGDIYFETWNGGMSTCSWTFVPPGNSNSIFLIKFLQFRHRSRTHVILNGAQNPNLEQRKVVDSTPAWCGAYATVQDQSCRKVIAKLCSNPLVIVDSWPPTLNVVGNNYKFLITFEFLDCHFENDTAGNKFDFTLRNILFMTGLAVLFLLCLVLAICLWCTRKPTLVNDRASVAIKVESTDHQVYDLVRIDQKAGASDVVTPSSFNDNPSPPDSRDSDNPTACPYHEINATWPTGDSVHVYDDVPVDEDKEQTLKRKPHMMKPLKSVAYEIMDTSTSDNDFVTNSAKQSETLKFHRLPLPAPRRNDAQPNLSRADGRSTSPNHYRPQLPLPKKCQW